MKKIVYMIVRFSVLLENSKSWNISKSDLKEYKDNLFNEERLRKHFELFKNITFPSILSQNINSDNYEFKLIIITSQELPKWNKELLEDLTSSYKWVEIHYLPTRGVGLTQPIYKDLNKYDEKVLFATIRLDDDDAIAVDFLENFERFFIEANSGYAVSFGLGLCGFYDFNRHQYSKLVEYYYPKFSAGLCYINIYNGGQFESEVKTIFQAGSHSKVDNRVPTIIYSKNIMFIRTMYEFSDSHNVSREKKLLKMSAVTPETIESRFAIEYFDRDFYLESNIYDLVSAEEVDRTKYNKRFDLHIGRRIYNYKYNGFCLSFYADFNPKSEEALVILPYNNKKGLSVLNDEAVNDFKGTKIIFMNPRLDSEDSRTTDLLDNDSYIKDLLEELIINIVNSNTLSKEKLSYLNIL